MKKQYVYIGQYYHVKNKQLPLDFKFGVTDNLDNREYSLGRTKSPIKYMILKAWELPSIVSREKVEKLISIIFDKEKYDGCEWYDIDGNDFQDKISSLFQVLTDMFNDQNIEFKEVIFEKQENTQTIEDAIEENIRKRSSWTNLKIEVDGINLSGESAREGFINFIKYVFDKNGDINIALKYGDIIKSDIKEFAEYKQKSIFKVNNFFLDTHSSTQSKKIKIENIIKDFSLDGFVEVID